MTQKFRLEDHKIKQEDLFPVNEEVFDRIENQVFAQTINKQTSKVIPLYKRWSVQLSAAAAVMALIIFVFVKDNGSQQEYAVDLGQVSDQEVKAYLFEEYSVAALEPMLHDNMFDLESVEEELELDEEAMFDELDYYTDDIIYEL